MRICTSPTVNLRAGFILRLESLSPIDLAQIYILLAHPNRTERG